MRLLRSSIEFTGYELHSARLLRSQVFQNKSNQYSAFSNQTKKLLFFPFIILFCPKKENDYGWIIDQESFLSKNKSVLLLCGLNNCDYSQLHIECNALCWFLMNFYTVGFFLLFYLYFVVVFRLAHQQQNSISTCKLNEIK